MKILVCVDLSDSTEQILKRIEELCQPLNAKIWLLHVAAPVIQAVVDQALVGPRAAVQQRLQTIVKLLPLRRQGQCVVVDLLLITGNQFVHFRVYKPQ